MESSLTEPKIWWDITIPAAHALFSHIQKYEVTTDWWLCITFCPVYVCATVDKKNVASVFLIELQSPTKLEKCQLHDIKSPVPVCKLDGTCTCCSDGLLLEVLAETPVTQHSPCYSAVSATLMNPLPDCSNYSPFCHTHYLILRINTSLVLQARPFTKSFRWRWLILHCCSALLQYLVGNSGETQYIEEAEQQRQVLMFLLLFKLSSQFPFVSFLSISLSSLCSLSQSSLFSLSSFPLASPPSLLSLLINSLSS